MLKKAKEKERILSRWDITNCLFQDEKSFVPHALHCFSEMYLLTMYKVTCHILWENKQMYPNNVKQFSGGLKAPWFCNYLTLIKQISQNHRKTGLVTVFEHSIFFQEHPGGIADSEISQRTKLLHGNEFIVSQKNSGYSSCTATKLSNQF